MAFTTLPDSIIQVGKALTRNLFKTYIKDNIDDLDSRLTTVEGATNKIVVFDDPVINASSASTLTGLSVYKAQADFNLTDCKIGIFTKGSLSGTLEVDIKKSSTLDFSAASSVFTTRPSLLWSAISDYAESSNVVFDNTNKQISEGDWLRFDVTSMPSSGTLGKFTIFLIGEPT